VRYLCDWLEVSRSGFYAWRQREESTRSKEDRRLKAKIASIHQESRGTYGSPRVHQVLKKQGESVGKKRIERLMQAQGLKGRVVRVTRRQPGLKRFKADGENLRLNTPAASGPGQVWVADVTYLKVNGQWHYLAAVMDVYSRRILGWSLARHRTAGLTLSALRYALKGRRPESGLIFHTDRGIEYTAFRFRDELKKHGIRASVNRPGCCTDNAHMESFFHTLKAELIRGRTCSNDADLRSALNGYINQFYNHKRLHSGIDYHPPAVYEAMAA
jgi:putative transposase